MNTKNHTLKIQHQDGRSIATAPRVVRAKRPPGMFVCGKCLKKCDQGRAIQKALKAALATQAKRNGRRPAKLIKTKCIGLCPKQAVAAANGASLARGEVLLLKNVEQAAKALDLVLGDAAL